MTVEDAVDAIRLSAADNVATVLRDVQAGQKLLTRSGDAIEWVIAAQAVPLCHKISLTPIKAGTPVKKFGETIGVARADIAAGTHVHIHNIMSCRGRNST